MAGADQYLFVVGAEKVQVLDITKEIIFTSGAGIVRDTLPGVGAEVMV